ncbi:hypothetical protein HOC35_04315 [Candidatus Woesearchaeota archaeon]|jgi:hypothetical protein|nr:hypothetical protein [Candidatus Woesearchaeota archaeon]
MKFSKNASLNLSVNAIVVFVLAFSMLGVGLYVTNLIRENVGSGITSVVNIQDLKSPPSAEDPITVSREVTLKKGKEIKLDIGYYNKETIAATHARIGISSCITPTGEELEGMENGGSGEDTLLVVSPFASMVGASEGKGYKIKIADQSEAGILPTGAYVCTMIVFDPEGDDKGSIDNPYEEKQFFLNIVS